MLPPSPPLHVHAKMPSPLPFNTHQISPNQWI